MTVEAIPIRAPRNLAGATALCEAYALLQDRIAEVEAERNRRIAAINAEADQLLQPLVADSAAIAGKLEPWWQANGAALAGAKCKSVELGGCLIGSRAGRATLHVAGAEGDVIELLSGLRWAKPFLRIKVSLDKLRVLNEIDGSRSAAFAELGLSARPGEEQFFVARAEQGRTVTT